MNPDEMKQPPTLSRMRQLAPVAVVLLSAVAAAGAYLQAFGYPFVSDDDFYITDNHKLAGLRLAELWRLLVEPYNSYSEFLPLRDLSYWFDITLFGLNPSVFRAHNIILYLLCLPLVYATTRELWRYFRPADAASAPWAAAAVTALFALHPTLVEPVVWISGRKYVLSNLFSMLALWFAVRARREMGLSAPHAAAALAAFVAVMLSKSSYVAVAPIIALLWVMFWRDVPAPHRRRSQLLWPLAILLLAAFLILVFIDSSISGKMPSYFGVEAATRSLAVLGWLARLSVSPESRHFLYPVFEDPYLPAMVALGVAVLAAAAIGAVMTLRKRSLEGFVLIVFFLLCLPYLQLVPYGAPSLVSDRFLALAAWPAMVLAVALSWRLKPVPRTFLLLAIVLPWGFQTMERPRDWRSFEAVIDADLRAYPGYYMPAAYKILVTQLPQGLYRDASETANSITTPEIRNLMTEMAKVDHAVHVGALAGKTGEAMAMLWKFGLDFRQPPVQTSWNPPVYNLWGRSKVALGNEWMHLAESFPDDASVRYNVGLWLASEKKYKGAIPHLRAAVESQRLPESVRGTAFKNLGFALMGSGHVAEAEAPLRAALVQQPPDLRAYCLLSGVYTQTKQFAEAASAEANCPGRAHNEGTAQ